MSVDFKIVNGHLKSIALLSPTECLVIPEQVTEIDEMAMDISSSADDYRKSVRTIVIPASVKKCARNVFKGFVHLENIEVDEKSSCFCLIGKTLYSKDKSILYMCPKNTEGGYEVNPDLSTEIISAYAFEYCTKITEIEQLPEWINYLGDYCFSHVESARRINLMTNVGQSTYLGKGVFSGCKSLEAQWLPHHLETVPEEFFKDCSNLSRVRLLDDNLKTIKKGAFCGCSSLLQIGDDPSADAGKNVHFAQNVSEIESKAFAGCSEMTEVIFDNPNISIADDAFTDCRKVCFFGHQNGTAEKYAEKHGERFYPFESSK